MKIGATSSPAADAAALARANADIGAAAAAKTRGPHEAAGSSVKLSSAAAGLLSAASTPEIDAAKVDRIRQAIADGTFKVDAEAIADKLIANAQELLGAVKR